MMEVNLDSGAALLSPSDSPRLMSSNEELKENEWRFITTSQSGSSSSLARTSLIRYSQRWSNRHAAI
jgi:hypothetical protein